MNSGSAIESYQVRRFDVSEIASSEIEAALNTSRGRFDSLLLLLRLRSFQEGVPV